MAVRSSWKLILPVSKTSEIEQESFSHLFLAQGLRCVSIGLAYVTYSDLNNGQVDLGLSFVLYPQSCGRVSHPAHQAKSGEGVGPQMNIMFMPEKAGVDAR